MVRQLRNSAVAVALALTLAASATADERMRSLTPVDLEAMAPVQSKAGTSGVAGIRNTILSGDPSKPGLYTIRLEIPAHVQIDAHTHRDERSAVVIKGEWSYGFGPRFDEAALKRLPPGSFYTEPAGLPHFARTGDQPVVVYITGFGPTSTVYEATNATSNP